MQTPDVISGIMELSKEEATEFLSQFYGGTHHIPGKLHDWGYGWMIKHDRGEFSTYDFNQLTRLVLMAHEKAIRVSIAPHTFNSVKLIIHKRQREGRYDQKHPTIEQAIESYNTQQQNITDGK